LHRGIDPALTGTGATNQESRPPSQQVDGGGSAIAPVAEIRRQFPALARSHHGHSVAYFDAPGGTQVPDPVLAAMGDYLLHHNANTHWAYPTSQETDTALWQAREAFADLFNASPTEVVFGLNMTSLTFQIARALGSKWGPGDEVVVTEIDHHANVTPWRALERERGVRVRMARMAGEAGQVDWEHLGTLLRSQTRLLAIGAASSALGTITDVARASALAHAVGALCFVDAVHYAAHAPLDVPAIDCDFLACSAYKLYGPHVGVLYGKRALLESLQVAKIESAPDDTPERLETGTQNHEGIVGAAAGLDFLASLVSGGSRRERLVRVLDAWHNRGRALCRRLGDGLGPVPGLRSYAAGDGTARTATMAFTVEGIAPRDVVRRLAEEGLFCCHGDFYAPTLMKRLGLGSDGLVRAGCACYTTEEEIDRLIQAVKRLTRR